MAEAIMEFIREYGIATKVGYFMMDNATNMNTMIDKVSDDLEHEFEVFYDPLPHRLRCFGHIINLAVMEFLIGKRPPTADSYHGPSDDEVKQWRKRGAIGKLHNIVVYITWTPSDFRHSLVSLTVYGYGATMTLVGIRGIAWLSGPLEQKSVKASPYFVLKSLPCKTML
ncbi:transposase-like protein [Hirsutella rhossiliensis]|uniref:Transposase-like protein n=1 Tax=Hirsutella rhossiliensis TaxID=111463 RepID=A0A9P8MLQ9_9HYPO|nr:transposase-like protein [Hirsutella rhossiliensis]KAH0957647.1 transposase-like protein [Hirsutella rhossiliensis]